MNNKSRMNMGIFVPIACIAILLSTASQQLGAFTYDPVGKLEAGSGTGRVDEKVYVPGLRFPIENSPAFANSQVYRKGGFFLGGSQCDLSNYSYPWRDNFCETRGRLTSYCPTGKGHQGQDIRPATCANNAHWAVAAEGGTISRTRGWTVSLVGDATGIRHNYLHLNPNTLAVKVGDRVETGQRIGQISNYFGSTPTTIHLHYELRSGSTPLPPYTSLVSSYKELIGDDSGPDDDAGPDNTDDDATESRAVTASGSDFDGDGRDDLYWYRRGPATDYIWYSSGRSFAKRRLDAGGEFTPISGDYDGDGKTDIFWYRAGEKYDYIWYSTGTDFRSVRTQVIGSYTPISGDFDGNGIDDIFWYRPGTGADYVWYSDGSGTFNPDAVTVNGDYTPVAGDFDGNGKDDIFWYRPGEALDYVWYGQGAKFITAKPQITGAYQPISGDFNGDTRADIFWYAPGTAADRIATSIGTEFELSKGNAVPILGTYRPIKGNFDGDAYDDIVWYQPGAGNDWIYYGTDTLSFEPIRTAVTVDFIPVP